MSDREQWLLDELPRLQREGVINAGAAAALHAHYAQAAAAPAGPLRPALGLVISAVLGVALIGLGVILLLAHNWDDWSRATRTFVSLAPLVLAQGLSLWALRRRGDSAAWLESAATAQALAVAAAIALVGQTYHLYGNLDDYLLSCALLALPLVYVMRSTVVAAVCALTFGAWAWQTSSWLWLPLREGASLYPLWLGLLVPTLVRELRTDRHSLRSAILLWSMTISFAVAMPAIAGWHGGWAGTYAALFAACYLADARWFGGERLFFGRPLRTIGALGIAVLALGFASREGWRELGYGLLPAGHGIAVVLPAAVILAALGLWLLAWREREPATLVFGALPVLVLLAPSLGHGGALVAFNLYAAALAFVTVRQGFHEQRLRTLNFGLAIAAGLALMRFVDSDLPYTVRGIGFVVVGAAVLGANLWVVRRRRSAA
ncbi:MAG TPA: DUF2157 domain-containing protein [Solimonas sp.]|nr:DUF2157 domain-containing protein [Solimonas sp.]